MKKNMNIPIYLDRIEGEYSIPDSFNSYTLFFATSYELNKPFDKKYLKKMNKQFKSFGKSIGENHLAVWVKNIDSDDLNVDLGKTYADRLHRWYNSELSFYDGPYLIFMSNTPDAIPRSDDFLVVISFKNKKPEAITEIIEYLEATIRRDEISKYKIQTKLYWLDFETFLVENKESLKTIGKEIIIKVIEKRL
ncbi:hypothetical protein [Desulfobacter curvatus]|uniref:hypothetical protein n=1 Tax=Desulfobacter curvatus TaxID=2290 RepID=UPI0012FBB497|nr:hypothetical protein [Desulfobacter curvatus]